MRLLHLNLSTSLGGRRVSCDDTVSRCTKSSFIIDASRLPRHLDTAVKRDDRMRDSARRSALLLILQVSPRARARAAAEAMRLAAVKAHVAPCANGGAYLYGWSCTRIASTRIDGSRFEPLISVCEAWDQFDVCEVHARTRRENDL